MQLIEELEPVLQVLRYAVEYPQAGILRVTGYVSSSTKEVLNLDLRSITQEEYQTMARDSLRQLKQHRYEMPKDIPKDILIKAIDELSTSLERSAASGGTDTPRHERLYADMVGGIYYKDEGRKVILKQLVVLERTVVSKPPPNPRARGSAPKTLAKEAIRAQTPIDKYLGRIDLTLGKFSKVEIIT